MNKKQPVLLLIALVTLLIAPGAQAQRRGFNYTEVGGLFNWDNSAGGNSSFNAFRVRTGINRIVIPHAALGIALGTDNFKRNTGEAYTALPVTANLSFFTNQDLRGFKADLYSGYSIGIFNNIYNGFTAGAGLSYNVPLNKNLNIGLQTGYNYQELNLPARFLQDRLKLGSLRLGVGLTFR